MNDYGNFHDGVLEGVWVDDSTAYVFLSTLMKERFAVVADGIVALTVTNFKKGNLIFEVVARGHEELTMDDIAALYDLREGKEGEEQAAKLLAKARQERLSILDIKSVLMELRVCFWRTRLRSLIKMNGQRVIYRGRRSQHDCAMRVFNPDPTVPVGASVGDAECRTVCLPVAFLGGSELRSGSG